MEFVEEILSDRGRMSHKFGMGPWVTKLEKAFAKKYAMEFCAVFPAGTPALVRKMMDIAGNDFLFYIAKVEGFPGVWLALTRIKEYWEALKKMASQGYDLTSNLWENKSDSFGMNFRMTELLAALIYAKVFEK